MGHGIEAAAAMAQIRAAIRGFVTIDPDPRTVVDRLQKMFVQLQMTRLVSMIYAIADRDAGVIDMVNVGAMPPLLLRADAEPQLVHLPVCAMLGADPEPAIVSRVAHPPGTTVLLYTDGLVERRREMLDAGWQRLRRHAQALVSTGLDDGLRELAQHMRDTDGHDDITILALRSTRSHIPDPVHPKGRP